MKSLTVIILWVFKCMGECAGWDLHTASSVWQPGGVKGGDGEGESVSGACVKWKPCQDVLGCWRREATSFSLQYWGLLGVCSWSFLNGLGVDNLVVVLKVWEFCVKVFFHVIGVLMFCIFIRINHVHLGVFIFLGHLFLLCISFIFFSGCICSS